jgi:carboxylesterase
MRPLGEALAARGFPVRGVLLPGHGTTVEDLARARWTDWCDAVVREAERLAAETQTQAVAAVGMSLGGLLALHLAATRPDLARALVLCGTPIESAALRVRLLPYLARVPWFAARWATIPKRGDGGPDIADPIARAASTSYRAMPLPGVLELLELQRVVRGELDRVRQPTLLLHGRHDHNAPVTSMVRLRQKLGSRTVEAHVLERSWHVVTLDYDRDEVARLTADFLDRVARGEAA